MIMRPPDKRPLWRTMAAFAPNGIVFLSNAAIMVLELVAGRLISPYLGMSLYTWTTIIGVIMAGMSLGNYVGGRLADRFRPMPTLAVLFALSSGACFLLLPLNELMGGALAPYSLAWPLRILLHVTPLFFLPAALLGTINPVVARWALSVRANAGSAVGGVFAWGVLGSIVGTFSTGFYWIYLLGVVEIVCVSAAVLGFLAVCCGVLAVVLRDVTQTLTADTPGTAELAGPRAPFQWLGTNATVFASNAAFMILELAASRMLARHFGASLYTWTTIIGIVLAGVALGNYAGGRIADRRATRGTIATVFVLAALATLCSPKLADVFMSFKSRSEWLMGMSWPLQITCFMIFVFFLPCAFIGCISPIVVKRSLDQGIAAGHAVGNIYAWGAVGSIVGTFATGFFLIDWFGSLATMAGVSVLLAVVGVFYSRVFGGGMLAVSLVAVAIAMLPFAPAQRAGAALGLRIDADPRVVYEDESQYSYIAVRAQIENPNIREMFLDKLVHSRIEVGRPEALEYPYEWIYEATTRALYPAGQPLRAMVIGGGGYAYPHYLEVTRPGSHIEVAEIDPAVTEAAHAAFGLPRETTIHVYNMDARNHVSDLIRQQATAPDFEKFDVIYGDSINDYTVPYHLTTREFAMQVQILLKDDGVYMINLIDIFDSGAFLGAVANTCKAVFPFVYVLSTRALNDVRDTFVVIGSQRALNSAQLAAQINQDRGAVVRAVSHIDLKDLISRHGSPLLTDNYAPVENMLLPVVRSRDLGEVTVHYNLGVVSAARGDLPAAIAAWEKAIQLPRPPEWDQLAIKAQADSYYNLAVAYMKQGDTAKAQETVERMQAAGYTPPADLLR